MEEIFKFLSKIRPMSPECVAYLEKVIKFKKLRKKDILLKVGEVNDCLFFIAKGSLKCYYYHNGLEVCDWFFFETDTVVAIASFYLQLPSDSVIEAMGDTEVFYITKADYDYLKWHYHDFCYIACDRLEKYLVDIHSHGKFIRKQSPVESYHLVLAQRPKLVNSVTVKDLASWLNMDPSTLSRARSEGV